MKRAMYRSLALALLMAVLGSACAYALDGYFIEDSDERLLTREELMVYSKAELPFVRAEILARHGYPFDNSQYADHFEAQSWYQRNDDFTSDVLSAIEMENYNLIKEVEAGLGASASASASSDGSSDGDYILPDSDIRLLTKSELREYSLSQLGYIRNEILARHGYPFKTEAYREYFESQWWYVRDEGFDYNYLSKTEMKNVELIQAVEKEKGK